MSRNYAPPPFALTPSGPLGSARSEDSVGHCAPWNKTPLTICPPFPFPVARPKSVGRRPGVIETSSVTLPPPRNATSKGEHANYIRQTLPRELTHSAGC